MLGADLGPRLTTRMWAQSKFAADMGKFDAAIRHGTSDRLRRSELATDQSLEAWRQAVATVQ